MLKCLNLSNTRDDAAPAPTTILRGIQPHPGSRLDCQKILQ